jgi:hypothetical protein
MRSWSRSSRSLPGHRGHPLPRPVGDQPPVVRPPVPPWARRGRGGVFRPGGGPGAEGKEGLARWTMRNKEYVGPCARRTATWSSSRCGTPRGDLPLRPWSRPAAGSRTRELKMAEQLVARSRTSSTRPITGTSTGSGSWSSWPRRRRGRRWSSGCRRPRGGGRPGGVAGGEHPGGEGAEECLTTADRAPQPGLLVGHHQLRAGEHPREPVPGQPVRRGLAPHALARRHPPGPPVLRSRDGPRGARRPADPGLRDREGPSTW